MAVRYKPQCGVLYYIWVVYDIGEAEGGPLDTRQVKPFETLQRLARKKQPSLPHTPKQLIAAPPLKE